MDLNNIRLNAVGEKDSASTSQQAEETAEAKLAEESAQPAAASAQTNNEDDEMPILIPDDYDVEDIDYSARNTMSDVVAAKESIEQQPRYQRPKLKGKEALDNFMYHHKTGLIVGIVAVIMLAIIIVQSIPEKYDYYFNVYAGTSMGMNSIAEIEAQLLPYAVDVDGDEEIKINIASYNRNGISDPYESIVAYMFIESEFGGEFNAFLVMLDKDHYNFIVENVGEDIFEAYEDNPVLIPVGDTGFVTSASDAFDRRDDLYLALIAVPERFKDDEKMVARHDAAEALLGRLLEGHPGFASEQTAG